MRPCVLYQLLRVESPGASLTRRSGWFYPSGSAASPRLRLDASSSLFSFAGWTSSDACVAQAPAGECALFSSLHPLLPSMDMVSGHVDHDQWAKLTNTTLWYCMMQVLLQLEVSCRFSGISVMLLSLPSIPGHALWPFGQEQWAKLTELTLWCCYWMIVCDMIRFNQRWHARLVIFLLHLYLCQWVSLTEVLSWILSCCSV
jgi:hypothetical protein